MIEKSSKPEINQPKSAVTANSRSQAAEFRAKSTDDDSREARLFEVVIAGVPLRLKSSHDEQTVNELVALVDHKVREALTLTKTGSIQNASILASLHIAEEYLNLKHKAKAELGRLEARALKVISELESSRIAGPQGQIEIS